MGTVMGVMMAFMLIGVLVWGGHHGMMGDHDRGGHAEESIVREDAQNPCQREVLKEAVNPDDAEDS